MPYQCGRASNLATIIYWTLQRYEINFYLRGLSKHFNQTLTFGIIDFIFSDTKIPTCQEASGEMLSNGVSDLNITCI